MIRYDRFNWWSILFIFRSGVIGNIYLGILVYMLYTTAQYFLSLHYGLDVIIRDVSGSVKSLGGFVSFLLIFRLNQCHARYCEGKALTATLFHSLHSIIDIVCSYTMDFLLKSEEDRACMENWRMAIAARVHTVRLTLAVSSAFRYHCRIAEVSLTGGRVRCDPQCLLFDYIRLIGLLYPSERDVVDSLNGLYVESIISNRGPCRTKVERFLRVNFKRRNRVFDAKVYPAFSRTDAPSSYRSAQSEVFTPAHDGPRQEGAERMLETSGVHLMVPILNMLRQHLLAPVNKPWGYPERLVNVFEGLTQQCATTMDHMDQLVSMPLPVAYLQHCKALFLSFAIIYPLTLHAADGFWANAISPVFLFFALSGFEALADQMENPLGDDVADLNIYEMAHDLECRARALFDMSTLSSASLREVRHKPVEHMLKAQALIATSPGEGHGNGNATPFGLDLPEGKQGSKEQHTALVGLRRVGNFKFHFSWVKVPPQLSVFIADSALAQGHELMIKLKQIGRRFAQTSLYDEDGLTPSASLYSLGQEYNYSDMHGSGLADDQVDIPEMILHFVCLKENRAWVVERIEELGDMFMNTHDGFGTLLESLSKR